MRHEQIDDYLWRKDGREKRHGRAKSTLLAAGLLIGLGLPGANALAKSVTVKCPKDSIQAKLNNVPPASTTGTMINIKGTCTENVLVTQDNVTFNGLPDGTVNGTFTVDGARRVVFQNLKVTGTGNGIVVTRNGTATVQDSEIRENHDNGIIVKDGAQVDILSNQIVENGQDPSDPDQGFGISVSDGGNARIIGNEINKNLSWGVDSSNGAQVRLELNTIKENGRLTLFESGAIVSRAKIVANGNVYQDNAYAAIDVFNDGSYRTGRGLSLAGVVDNPLGFESLKAGTGQIAVSIGRGSIADLRQVIVQGAIEIGSDSLLHIRGDNVGPDTQCSEVVDITAYAVNSTIELGQYTKVNGTITADPNQGNRVTGNDNCPLP